MIKKIRYFCATRNVAYIFIVVSLNSCVVPYRPPENAPLAKVRFVTSSGLLTRVLIFDNENCERGDIGGQLGVVGGWGSAGEISKLNMFDKPVQSNKIIEREVHAGYRVYFAFHQSFTIPQASTPEMYRSYTYSCNVTLSFIPQADHQYEILHRNMSDNKCDASVFELVKFSNGTISRKAETSLIYNKNQCSYKI